MACVMGAGEYWFKGVCACVGDIKYWLMFACFASDSLTQELWFILLCWFGRYGALLVIHIAFMPLRRKTAKNRARENKEKPSQYNRQSSPVEDSLHVVARQPWLEDLWPWHTPLRTHVGKHDSISRFPSIKMRHQYARSCSTTVL